MTDYDAWRAGEAVDVAQILQVMAANAQTARTAVARLAASLPERREPSPIDHALDGAIMTAPAMRDKALAARLDAIAGRVLQ